MFSEVKNVLATSCEGNDHYTSQQEPVLDIKEIQGHILPESQKNYQTLLFFEIEKITTVRHWLLKIQSRLTTMETVLNAKRQKSATSVSSIQETWINLAFTFSGLRKLTKDADLFQDFAFKEGLHHRSRLLGDPIDRNAEGNCHNWVIGSPLNIPDLMLIVASDEQDELQKAVQTLDLTRESGLRFLFEQPGSVLPSPLREHEHFGFRDCISQPCLRGRISQEPKDFLVKRETSANCPQGKPGYDLIWPGEFIFGYPTQNPIDSQSSAPNAEAGPSWAKNGSYLVFRRLRQDVSSFKDFLVSLSQDLTKFSPALPTLTPETLAAKLMGRWYSGAPIVLSPQEDNPQMGSDHGINNHFKYEASDPKIRESKESICPAAAHIRKAFPRDTHNLSDNETVRQTHRLLRRGVPFGEASPGQKERGLLFLAYQTSIERQFEFITTNWINNPNFPDTGDGYDPIVGQNNNPGEQRQRQWTLPVEIDDTVIKIPVNLPQDWVIPTGGGYFFVPSLTGLSMLAVS
ncbi:MAG: Dyp-type peroxidase [Crocosphaera sp.]